MEATWSCIRSIFPNSQHKTVCSLRGFSKHRKYRIEQVPKSHEYLIQLFYAHNRHFYKLKSTSEMRSQGGVLLVRCHCPNHKHRCREGKSWTSSAGNYVNYPVTKAPVSVHSHVANPRRNTLWESELKICGKSAPDAAGYELQIYGFHAEKPQPIYTAENPLRIHVWTYPKVQNILTDSRPPIAFKRMY